MELREKVGYSDTARTKMISQKYPCHSNLQSHILPYFRVRFTDPQTANSTLFPRRRARYLRMATNFMSFGFMSVFQLAPPSATSTSPSTAEIQSVNSLWNNPPPQEERSPRLHLRSTVCAVRKHYFPIHVLPSNQNKGRPEVERR